MEMEEQEQEQRKAPQHCEFWLPRKARFCAAMALPNLTYCGNHKPPDVEIRLPCPIDPSHTILQAELEAHSRKCPALMRLQQLEEMQYYWKGANAGSDNEDTGCADHQEHCCRILQSAEIMEGSVQSRNARCQEEIIGQQKQMANRQFMFRDVNQHKGYCSSKMKRTISNSLSEQDFTQLMRKIESAYDLHCKGEIESTFQQPPACNKWVNAEADRRIPFQEKHVLQQASLLGNLERFGLLQSPDSVSRKESMKEEAHSCTHAERVYVEFGAGRGYLAHMLADCYKVQSLVLVERRSYKFKADRTLRQNGAVSFERLRIDIEDLDLQGVKSLQGRHYIALSKHLCGYATDLTLRCCYSNSKRKGSCSRFKAKNAVEYDESLEMPLLDGLAIASCCHHLCQWKPYVNKDFFRSLGFTKKDFYILTWLTSWALSGDKEHVRDDDTLTEYARRHEDQSSFTLSTSYMNTDTAESRESADGQDGFIKWASERADRIALGLKCKQLLDAGRIYWLRKNGMDAKLVSFVPPTISPENKLLLARSVCQADD